MFCAKVLTHIPLMLSVLILIMEFDQSLYRVEAATVNLDNLQRPHRPISRAPGRIQVHYGKNRPSLSDFLDDDDLFDMSKRQVTDDYGHLRFGKRGEDFDDYGHLRFGRSPGE